MVREGRGDQVTGHNGREYWLSPWPLPPPPLPVHLNSEQRTVRTVSRHWFTGTGTTRIRFSVFHCLISVVYLFTRQQSQMSDWCVMIRVILDRVPQCWWRAAWGWDGSRDLINICVVRSWHMTHDTSSQTDITCTVTNIWLGTNWRPGESNDRLNDSRSVAACSAVRCVRCEL